MTFSQILLIVWDTPLLIFHVSMILMLCVQKIKRNKDLEKKNSNKTCEKSNVNKVRVKKVSVKNQKREKSNSAQNFYLAYVLQHGEHF
jgi:hypothetical protein